ncbi:MAG: DNA-directed RNA polymerase subunit beta, partial [Planctomycetes bacterium]|nr:DNA-directed RNA polymerase subunit beta [Planctomycetota bacterium]
MATTAQRRLKPQHSRRFGRLRSTYQIPDLTEIQTRSYAAFLQYDLTWQERSDQGIEGVLREIFPVESYDKTLRLEYIRYELGKPRYEPDECRQLRLTYGRPFKVWLRLTKEQPVEEEVYLGDIPIMLGGGEFIINGAERVVVSQLHRSPGVDFVSEIEGASERRLQSCRIIPERGSWIELNVNRKENLTVRIDQSGKFSIMTLLRAMDQKYSDDANLLRVFFPTETVKVTDGRSASKIEGKMAVGDVIYPSDSPRAGEIIVECAQKITKNLAETICTSGLKQLELMDDPKNPLLLNALADDNTASHEEALLRIYQRLRPGNPPQLEKARILFHEKFYDTNRYRLGRVGRFRINRKLGLNIDESEMTLRPDDLISAIKYIVQLRAGEPGAEIDDIDHLGNRRLRTIDELASDELRKGFLKLRRTVQERMSLKDLEDMTPRSLVNPKSISAAIEYFFGRGELSQVVDQTNPLSMLTHERRLSALGPGGLNRKRAGFEVRDVHISHYGRICPIETPEGTNIGLISSLAIYAGVDEYGFLVTPYQKIHKGQLTDRTEWLRADQEHGAILAPADALVENGRLAGETIIARHRGDFQLVPVGQVQYIDVAPSQMVGVSAGLIPFLEHDDANRALMGSNMQRQAVPLLVTEPPLVATGLEKEAALNSSMLVRARRKGTVTRVDSGQIEIGADVYKLRKFVGLNERTCQNQKPIVRLEERVEKGQVIADGAGTQRGELALGRNVLVAFMAWDGFNFEDAIIISE